MRPVMMSHTLATPSSNTPASNQRQVRSDSQAADRASQCARHSHKSTSSKVLMMGCSRWPVNTMPKSGA